MFVVQIITEEKFRKPYLHWGKKKTSLAFVIFHMRTFVTNITY